MKRALAIALMTLPMLAAGSAGATTTPNTSCTAGGDTITNSIDYFPDGTSYRVDWWNYRITGNTASHNNVNIRYFGYAGASTYFSWNSPDDRVGGNQYYYYNQRYAPKASTPYARFQGIFDQNGGDPSCYSYNKNLTG